MDYSDGDEEKNGEKGHQKDGEKGGNGKKRKRKNKKKRASLADENREPTLKELSVIAASNRTEHISE